MFVANIVDEIRRHGGRGYLRAAAIGMRWRCPDRRERRRRLHHRRLGMYRTCARMMILALPQFAADKADCDHGSVAANHFPKLPVQPREFARLRDRVLRTRKFVDARVLDL